MGPGDGQPDDGNRPGGGNGGRFEGRPPVDFPGRVVIKPGGGTVIVKPDGDGKPPQLDKEQKRRLARFLRNRDDDNDWNPGNPGKPEKAHKGRNSR